MAFRSLFWNWYARLERGETVKGLLGGSWSGYSSGHRKEEMDGLWQPAKKA